MFGITETNKEGKMYYNESLENKYSQAHAYDPKTCILGKQLEGNNNFCG
jgi:hypothetical protein